MRVWVVNMLISVAVALFLPVKKLYFHHPRTQLPTSFGNDVEASVKSQTQFNDGVESLRRSRQMFDFLHSFDSQSRKELSFALFVENDPLAFLLLVRNFDPKIKWTTLPITISATLLNLTLSDLMASTDITRVVDTIWCLGKLAIDINTETKSRQSIKLRSIIVQKVESIDPYILSRDTSRLLYSLSLLNFNWNSLSKAMQNVLATATAKHIPTMNDVEVANLLYAMGRMEVVGNRFGCFEMFEFHKTLFIAIERTVGRIESPLLSNILWGMGKMKMEWQYLPERLKIAVCSSLIKLQPIGPKALALSLTGLNKMGAEWLDLPLYLRESIEDCLFVIETAEEQSICNIIWALGSMSTYDSEYRTETFHVLQRASLSKIEEMEPIGLINCFHGFAKLGLAFSDMDPKLQVAVEKVCTLDENRRTYLLNLEGRYLANFVWSLGVMRATWVSNSNTSTKQNSLSLLMCNLIITAIDKLRSNNGGNTNEQSVCMLLNGLSKLGLRASNLPANTQANLLYLLTRIASTLRSQGVCNSLSALVELGFRWSANHTSSIHPSYTDLTLLENETDEASSDFLSDIAIIDSKTQQALLQAIKNNLDDLKPNIFATCCSYLGKIQCSYTELRLHTRGVFGAVLLKCVSSRLMKPGDLARVLAGLARMGARLQSLSNAQSTGLLTALLSVVSQMNEQALGQTIWALGQLVPSFNTLNSDLQSKICESVCNQTLTHRSLTAILQGLGMTGLNKWQSLPPKLNHHLLGQFQILLHQRNDYHDNINSSYVHSNLASTKSTERIKLVGNALFSLGRLNFDWLSGTVTLERKIDMVSLKKLVFSVLKDAEPTKQFTDTQSIINAANGLARTGVSWNDMTGYEIHDTILSVFPALSIEYASRGVKPVGHIPNRLANLLWSLGQMNAKWIDVENQLSDSLFPILKSQLPHMTPFEFVWTVWALSCMAIEYNELPLDLSKCLNLLLDVHLPTLEGQLLGVLLRALGHMKAPFDQLPPTLVAKLFVALDKAAVIESKRSQQ